MKLHCTTWLSDHGCYTYMHIKTNLDIFLLKSYVWSIIGLEQIIDCVNQNLIPHIPTDVCPD